MWGAMGWLIVVFAGGDLASTELALNRPGVYEMNPLMQNKAVRISSKVAVTGLVLWGTEDLRKKHPKWAMALRVGVVVGWGYATAHNLRKAFE